jgi:subtilisin family serine protease
MNLLKSKGLFALALLTVSGAASAQNIIVRLVRRTDASAVAIRYGICLEDQTPGAPFVLYRALSSTIADAVEARMKTDPKIVWAEDDDNYSVPEDEGLKGGPYKGSTLPAVGDRTVLYKGNENALAQINFDKVAAGQIATRQIKVAIIDSGLSPNQTYLWNKVKNSVNFVEPGTAAYDISHSTDTNGDGVLDGAVGHGTMVAGIIDQLAPKSKFTIVRIADSDGIGTAWRLIKGLAYAVTSGCELANLSMGSLNDLPAMSDVMDWCEEKNLLVVAAMGNNGVEAAAYPARISKVIAVGGLNPDNTKAAFSNFDGKCDLSAPATGIISQWHTGEIGIWSGTSFSAPMVTGAIADALKRTSTRMTAAALRSIVEGTGNDLDRLNPNYKGKVGLLLDVKKLASRISGGA